MLPISRCMYKIDYVASMGISPHTHGNTSEIIQTFDNFGTVGINDRTYPVKKNGLYFINGRTPHFVSPQNLDEYNHTILHLNIPNLEIMCENFKIKQAYEDVFLKDGGLFCNLTFDEAIKIDTIMLGIYNEMNSNSIFQYANISSLLSQLIQFAYDFTVKTNDGGEDIVSLIDAYISSNIPNKILLDDIAATLHLSKYHMCRIFHQFKGMTIGEYTTKKRLHACKRMLKDTNLSITAISEKCGFSNASMMSKAFQKEYSLLPSAYRKNYQN